MKKDGEKADKILQTENEKNQKDSLEREKKRVEEETMKELALKMKIEMESKELNRKYEEARTARLCKVKDMQKNIDEYNAAMEGVQKKLKNLRKKLRDIEELECKILGGLKPSKEQKDKVEKKQSVEDDITEMEETEDELKEREPPTIPPHLLVEECERDNNDNGNEIRDVSVSVSVVDGPIIHIASKLSTTTTTTTTPTPLSLKKPTSTVPVPTNTTATTSKKANKSKSNSKSGSSSDPWSTVDTTKKNKNK